MRPKILTVTETARNFSDYVNRVAYRRECFLLRKGRKVMAELRPVPSGRRLGEIPAVLGSLPRLSDSEAKRFANEISVARATLRRKGLTTGS